MVPQCLFIVFTDVWRYFILLEKWLTLAIIMFLSFQLSYGQGVNSNWIIRGNNFQFVDGQIITHGKVDLDANASCWDPTSTFTDENGDILFYTDGYNIYNSDFQPTPNGKRIKHATYNPSGLRIVKDLFETGQHYIFHIDDLYNRLYFSIFNQYLDNGKGDLIKIKKNKLLIEEDIRFSYIEVLRGICDDLWLIAKVYEKEELFLFLMDGDKINDPIKMTLQESNWDHLLFYGGLKASEDGKWLALDNGLTELSISYINDINNFDFLSTRIALSSKIGTKVGVFTKNNQYYYSLELSNSITNGVASMHNIFRYRLDKDNISTIGESKELIQSLNLNFHSDLINLSMGIDSNIYFHFNDSLDYTKQYFARITNVEEVLDAVNTERMFYQYPGLENNICGSLMAHRNIITRRPSIDPLRIISEQNSICKNKELELKVINDNVLTYQWSTGETSNTILINQPGSYWVTVDQGYCEASDTINIVNGELCDCDTYIPNAVSSSGNVDNSSFTVVSNCDIIDFDMKIYNRWGGLVYTSQNVDQGWSTIQLNSTPSSGVYSYIIKFRHTSNEEILTKKGTITVF